jgi:tRNA G10  N-methylase Trm11
MKLLSLKRISIQKKFAIFTPSVMTTDPQFLVRFVQQNPTFRIAELESCAKLCDISITQPLRFIEYEDTVPFAVLELENEAVATALVKRSILTQYHS